MLAPPQHSVENWQRSPTAGQVKPGLAAQLPLVHCCQSSQHSASRAHGSPVTPHERELQIPPVQPLYSGLPQHSPDDTH